MGGCRCSYRNCTNTTKTRDNLHFFHYPVKHKERCRQWIDNAQKPQFYDLDEDQLRNKVICETHFEDRFFPNMQKKRLLQAAVPTLDGDCEPRKSERNKIQDVQVLPANDDGTVFVLETNQNCYQPEKVESYIYTNNGLMLPITKSNETFDDSVHSVQTIYSSSEIEEVDDPPQVRNKDCKIFPMRNLEVNVEKEEPYWYSQLQTNSHQIIPVEQTTKVTMTDDIFSKTVGSKYVKKINQHSKDIAILKRLLKSRKTCRRPTTSVALGVLRKQLAPTLFTLINFNVNDKCEFTSDDLEFFSTIHSKSPEVYEILSQKYQWKLPNPQLFTNKNNGHVH